MNEKDEILRFIIGYLEEEYQKVFLVAQETKKSTTGDEVKQESKYDTRAIEAGYLAGAQARRVKEVLLELNQAKSFKVIQKKVSNTISIGSKFILVDQNSNIGNYFISPSRGGILMEKLQVNIISKDSPIATGAIGLSLNDDFEINTPLGPKEFTINQIQ